MPSQLGVTVSFTDFSPQKQTWCPQRSPPTRLAFFRFPPLCHLRKLSVGQGSRAFCDHSSDIPWVPRWDPLYCPHSRILSLHVVTVSWWVRPALLSIPAILFSLITPLLPEPLSVWILCPYSAIWVSVLRWQTWGAVTDTRCLTYGRLGEL